MRIKTLASLGLLVGSLGLTANAQTATISPIPQSAEWGTKAFDKTTSFTLTGAETADPDAVNVLKKHFTTTGGDIEIIIGERGDEAVAAYGNLIPEKNEGYYLKVEPGKVIIAGNDEQGTFYGVQSFLQVAAQPEVMSVTVTDWPMTIKRGVIEGFYGNPWSFEDRKSQFEFYGANKMNIYIYGPKDDVYHHIRWYEPYPEAEARRMQELVKCATDNKVKFVWAMHPSNSITSDSDKQKALAKFEQMYGLGVRAFAIFFDDISANSVNDQVAYLNFLTDEFVNKKGDVESMIVCPTQYNKAWSGGDYLSIMGAQLYPEIEIMWTGNSVCDMIQKTDTDWIKGQTGRKPFIWLNYPVNDYGQHNLLMGPLVDNGTDIYDQVSAFCSNPMQYAEASKVVLYSIADYTWNPSAFEPFSAWDRAITYLMPEHAEAFDIFCKSNVDVASSVHGLRIYHETPEFKSLIEKHTELVNSETAAALAAYFAKTKAAAEELLALEGKSAMVDEIKEFLQYFHYQAIRGEKIAEMSAALIDNKPENFIEAYTEYKTADESADQLVSRDFQGSIQSVKPHTATLYVEPFIKKSILELVTLFKESGAEYPDDLFPKMLLENGTYFIKVNGKYLTNLAGSSMPTFQTEVDDINEGRQRWMISLDITTERYKILNEWDKRYINEYGVFSAGESNPYEAVWHTYNLYRMNGKYAIQNAGRSGDKFWTANNTRISQSSSNELKYSDFIFEIIPTSGPAEHPVITDGKTDFYYIMDAEGKCLTNTNPNKSGGNPTFKPRETPAVRSQLWTFSIDNASGRFKILNASDNRYINELGNFGTNAYDAAWNSYTMTEFDGLFSIQNGGEAGTNYWYINGDRISKKEMDRSESYQFRIVHYKNATGISTPAVKDADIDIVVEGGKVVVKSASAVKSITVNSLDGKKMAESKNSPELVISNLPRNTYIVSAVCVDGQQTAKIQLP